MTLFDQYNHCFLKGSYKEKADKVIEGRRILNICENKLENFTFMDNIDFSSKELRKFLLISRTMYLTSWKIDVLNSDRGKILYFNPSTQAQNLNIDIKLGAIL